MRRSILWCSGWGINPDHFRDRVCWYWPDHEHHVLVPSQYFLQEVEKINMWNVDVIIGYSLGAALILNDYEYWVKKGKHIFLAAPFFDIKRDVKLGGCLSLGHLYSLRKLFVQAPINAINDFYQRAHLQFWIQDGALPYAYEHLLWGIDYLRSSIVNNEQNFGSKNSMTAVFGEADVLIDYGAMKPYFSNTHVISGATHCICTMLSFLKNQIQ